MLCLESIHLYTLRPTTELHLCAHSGNVLEILAEKEVNNDGVDLT